MFTFKCTPNFPNVSVLFLFFESIYPIRVICPWFRCIHVREAMEANGVVPWYYQSEARQLSKKSCGSGEGVVLKFWVFPTGFSGMRLLFLRIVKGLSSTPYSCTCACANPTELLKTESGEFQHKQPSILARIFNIPVCCYGNFLKTTWSRHRVMFSTVNWHLQLNNVF